MTKSMKAVKKFLQGFGLPCYATNTVPKKARLPYITYTPTDSNWSESASVSATIWFAATSLEELFGKVDEIKQSVGECYSIHIPGGGAVYIYCDNPFAQPVDTGEEQVKAAYLLFEVRTVCD